MKQRYNALTHGLCVRAALEAFEGKWRRPDFIAIAGKYSGVSRAELREDEKVCAVHAQLEAADGIAFELEERLDEVLDGTADDLDLDPVKIKVRRDGNNGKLRNIASCSVLHLCFSHLAVLGLKPLLRARILPFQHASLPGHGQTACKRQLERFIRRKSLGIRHAHKGDVEKAYPNTKREIVMGLLRSEIPSAVWLLTLIDLLLHMSPDGGLLIGGYMEAWLFNFVMSYALRYVLSREKVRRGKRQRLVTRVDVYMDDVVLLGRRKADIVSAARDMDRWMQKHLGIHFKPEWEDVSFLSEQEEHTRRRRKSPAGRGCVGVDIAGYVVRRTYTTIRKSIFKRARRQFLRAWRDIKRCGTIPLFRAKKVQAYKGYFDHTKSRKVREHLRVDDVCTIASAVIALHDREKGAVRYADCNI